MEGWCSVEELIRWGFEHAPVVMANGDVGRREESPVVGIKSLSRWST